MPSRSTISAKPVSGGLSSASTSAHTAPATQPTPAGAATAAAVARTKQPFAFGALAASTLAQTVSRAPMMILRDRVEETTITLGTATNFVITGATPGNRTFASVMAAGDYAPVMVIDSLNNVWETGLATLNHDGTLSFSFRDSATGSSLILANTSGKTVVRLTPTADWFGSGELMVTAAGGSLPRNLASRAIAAGFSILDFGTSPPGTGGDDYPAISGAISAASAAGGGIVSIPRGTFSTSSPIIIPSGVVLVGQGVSSVLQASATLPLNTALLTLTSGHSGVSRMLLANPLGYAQTAIHITKPANNTPIDIENIRVTNFSNGILVSDGDLIHLKSSAFIACGTAVTHTAGLLNSLIQDIYVLGGNGIDVGQRAGTACEGLQILGGKILPAAYGSFGIRLRQGLEVAVQGVILDQLQKADANGILIDSSFNDIGAIKISDSWTGCNLSGVLQGAYVISGGAGYFSPPTVYVPGVASDPNASGGQGATFTATIANGSVAAVTVTSGGSGYNNPPVISVSGGGGVVSGSIYGNSLTISSVLSGGIAIGQVLSGVNVVAGTTVVGGSGSFWTVSIAHAATGTQSITGAPVAAQIMAAMTLSGSGIKVMGPNCKQIHVHNHTFQQHGAYGLEVDGGSGLVLDLALSSSRFKGNCRGDISVAAIRLRASMNDSSHPFISVKTSGSQVQTLGMLNSFAANPSLGNISGSFWAMNTGNSNDSIDSTNLGINSRIGVLAAKTLDVLSDSVVRGALTVQGLLSANGTLSVAGDAAISGYLNSATIGHGTGDPNGVVAANPGFFYVRHAPSGSLLDHELWVKSTGTDASGWNAVATQDYVSRVLTARVPPNSADYILTGTASGTVRSLQRLMLHNLPHAVTLSAALPGSSMRSQIAATNQSVFSLSYIRAGAETPIATITFATGSKSGVIAVSAVPTLQADDTIALTAPSAMDPTLADLGWSFLATKQ